MMRLSQNERVNMRKILSLFAAALFLSSLAGCASNDSSGNSKERDDWQQYRSHKGQEELSKEVQQQAP